MNETIKVNWFVVLLFPRLSNKILCFEVKANKYSSVDGLISLDLHFIRADVKSNT